jgi:hypothetical protein
VAAIPADLPGSGALVFLADQSGRVFARRASHVPEAFPEKPADAGWRVVETPADLAGLRESSD